MRQNDPPPAVWERRLSPLQPAPHVRAHGRAPQSFKSGTVAIMGRPNVGKSTLLNLLVRYHLSAVSPRPQTTRHKILGVLTGDSYQITFLDTPGVPYRTRDNLNRRLVIGAMEALDEADLVVMMVEARPPADIETRLADELKRANKPAILAINKVDLVSKPELLPVMEQYSRLHTYLEIVPLSALQNDGVDALLAGIVRHLPEGEAVFPAEELTDRPEHFLVSEIVREQVFNALGEELPYSVAVEIDEFQEQSPQHGGKDYIRALLYVEKESQKGILIGRRGGMLKKIGVQSRQAIEALLERPVFLELWVKVYPKWRQDPAFLQRIGY
ncbi:MAG: GTPase Era [Chloroflexi bacterium]|nr:GTPase Era [Chloroflexota bacterium]